VTTRDPTKHRRTAARLAAVQALYQLEFSGDDAADVIRQFLDQPLDQTADIDIGELDRAFFEDLVKGVIRHQKDIDVEIEGVLATGWTLSRLDSTLRALFRVAAYEVSERKDVPWRVVIDEYLNVGHAFFGGEEISFANGVLDALARRHKDVSEGANKTA